jgi:phage shock protein C
VGCVIRPRYPRVEDLRPGTPGEARRYPSGVTEPEPRRIYRSRDDRVIGGVSGGIGEYLGIDPVLVRISFVALAFAGVGVLLYIIAWIAIPEGPSGETRQPVTGTRAGSSGAQMIVGSVLVALGVLFLLEWVIPIRRLLVPMAIIVVGIAIMAAGRSRP